MGSNILICRVIVVFCMSISKARNINSDFFFLLFFYSNTGKRLMAKCRLLHQENEELGKIISSGRVAKLEGDLALQRNFSEEMKKSQAGKL